MKQKLSSRRLTAYVIYSILINSLVLGTTFSGYKTEVVGQCIATAASSGVELAASVDAADPSAQIVELTVTNTGEVALEYTLDITATEGLIAAYSTDKSNYTVYQDGEKPTGTLLFGTGNNTTTWYIKLTVDDAHAASGISEPSITITANAVQVDPS